MGFVGSGNSGSRSITRRRPVPLSAVLLCGVVLAAPTLANAEPTFTFVDLQPKANHKLSDGLSDEQPGFEENHLAEVPRGERKLGEIPFRVGEKMIYLRGQHQVDAPTKVEGIPVAATFDRLHILHSTAYGRGAYPQEDGTEIGAYVVNYGDGTKMTIPIRYGEDLRDWWDLNRPEVDAKRARVAWTGTNALAERYRCQLYLFAVVWPNPHPEKRVETISFESRDTGCRPFLVALTLEKK